MKENFKHVLGQIAEKEISNSVELSNVIRSFFNEHVKSSYIEKYIGDFPTFIEPVYVEQNVSIGDDVLLGPNVYIGANVKIGDFSELSNVIVLDDALIGENMKFENCLILKNSKLNFSHFSAKNSIIGGRAEGAEELDLITF